MKIGEARSVGSVVGKMLHAPALVDAAMRRLRPVLAGRVAFPTLEVIGEAIVAEMPDMRGLFGLLDAIAETRAEGGWVIIASILRHELHADPDAALTRCRDYIVAADIWYATDIFGERLIGTLLLDDFDDALWRLQSWRDTPNPWIRRALGSGVHHWAKRAHAGPGSATRRAVRTKALLRFLEPAIAEHDIDAIKGIGWGLKTLGKYQPEQMATWIARMRQRHRGEIRALMLRKALTYLDRTQRARALGGT
ncbi:DNA alkylation repair protein [Bradyrhizobium diazoefficiens]|uniref:DNA alkylation repair protein n=1 Tax=Bradyrhizobium diazoefficiens TaxID=1355477 RepID=UPI0035957C58